ncbi:Hypothetical predicted protein [Octopus vulgaris]|uniref:Uncharacterized protein n=1 Tax=Octopus vulgaris TaxID=6645 RepID=A0AA36BCH7_OCTVU|nr:Hypothetical predicted protein [Octopus vulgaris]
MIGPLLLTRGVAVFHSFWQYVSAVTVFPSFIVDESSSTPPNGHYNLLFEELGFREDFWYFILVQPLRRTIFTIVQNPLFITCYNMVDKWISLVIKKKRRANFISVHFVIFIQIMWYSLLNFSDFLANLKFFCQFFCAFIDRHR